MHKTPLDTMLYLRLPANLKEQLQRLALEDDRELSNLVRVALKEYVANREALTK